MSEEFNYLRQQNLSLTEQHHQLIQILGDYSNSKLILTELSKLSIKEDGQELLIPLPGKIYLKGNVVQSSILVDIGRGAILPMPANDASKQLDEKIMSIKTGIGAVDKQISQVQGRMAQLEAELTSKQNFGVTPDGFS